MATEILRPNAAGSETNLSKYPDSGANWDKVDEETPDEDDTYVFNYESPSWKRDLYHLPAHSGSGTINKITLHFRVKSNISRLTVKGAIKSDSTVTETTEKNPYSDFGDQVWGNYSQDWAANPADSEAWEWADIDALQIGFNLKAAPFKFIACTQVYVEVEYGIAAAGRSFGLIIG